MRQDLLTFGWREWVALPDLGIDRIKAKIDTGARTSAIHAFALRTFVEDGRERVEFQIHPLQKDVETVLTCQADVLDKRVVSDSGGHREERIVIETTLSIGGHSWPMDDPWRQSQFRRLRPIWLRRWPTPTSRR